MEEKESFNNKREKEVYFVSIDENNQDFIRKLENIIKDEFKLDSLANKETFLLLMTIGFLKGRKEPLKKKYSYVRVEYFKEEEKNFIKAIAIFDSKGFKILKNIPEMYKIAEEYANGGISEIKDQIYLNNSISEVIQELIEYKLSSK